jgi:hypothetical protein
MVKNIINQGITDYGEDITTTNNPTKMTDLLGRYPGMDRIQELQNLDFQNNPRDMATGTASDFRHAAAMNELSKKATLGGLLPDVVGDTIAYGLGALNEAPDFFRGANPAMLAAGLATKNPSIMRAGLDDVSVAAGLEDDLANRLGTYGTPNTATIEDVFAKTLGYQAPGTNVVTQTASTGPFNYGTAQAAEVNPNQAINISTAPGIFDINQVGDPALNPGSVNAMGIDPFGVNEDLIDRGNPLGDSRVASEEMGLVGGIPDRGRGMPGAPTGAYEMIGGTPVAVGDVLGRQQALEKADFYEEPTQGINYDALGMLGTLGGILTGSTALRGLGLGANIASGKFGRAFDGISRGLGSLSGKMRGINPITGRPNTQSQYEQARTERQQQNRTDRMIDRITSGKRTSKDPRSAGTTAKQKADISAALRESRRAGQYTDKDSSGSSGSGTAKIVCTMMNERYGFGSFRNKIWMKFHEHHGPEYQKGYHAIFLPLVKIAKGEGKINTAVRKVLEHMGRHVTADMFKIMKGKKRDTLGRIYRAIFEPACHIIGKIKSALGRG